MQNHHAKTNSKHDADHVIDKETQNFTKRSNFIRKRNMFYLPTDISSLLLLLLPLNFLNFYFFRQEKRKHNQLDSKPNKVRLVKHRKKRDNKQITDNTSKNEKSYKGQFERSRKLNKGPPIVQKRKMTTGKKDATFKKVGQVSMLAKRRKFMSKEPQKI